MRYNSKAHTSFYIPENYNNVNTRERTTMRNENPLPLIIPFRSIGGKNPCAKSPKLHSKGLPKKLHLSTHPSHTLRVYLLFPAARRQVYVVVESMPPQTFRVHDLSPAIISTAAAFISSGSLIFRARGL